MQQVGRLMKHVALKEFGPPSVITLGESPIPTPKEGQCLVEIKATSVNRADTLQRQGKYPAPKGATNILGLECAGYRLAEDGTRQGRVMTILPGGGYAQYVAVNKEHLIPIPENIEFGDAGGIAEVYLTAFLQIRLANLKEGNSCLVYAAASGVGQATLQLCREFGIKSIGSCSKAKFPLVERYTQHVIDRNSLVEDQIGQIKQAVQGGVDAVFDCVGAQNGKLTLEALGLDGKWILYGLMGGANMELNLASLLGKRIQLIPTTLRARSEEFKSELIGSFRERVLPLLANGRVKVPVDRIVRVEWSEEGVSKIGELHAEMEGNGNAGKLNVVFE